jgi:hypothetical protein
MASPSRAGPQWPLTLHVRVEYQTVAPVMASIRRISLWLAKIGSPSSRKAMPSLAAVLTSSFDTHSTAPVCALRQWTRAAEAAPFPPRPTYTRPSRAP